MKGLKLLFRIEAVFCLAFGCFLLFRPELALKTVIIICAIYTLLTGIAGIILAIRNWGYEDSSLVCVTSIISAILGVLLLCFPQIGETILKIFVSLLGILIAIKGSFMVADSFTLKKQKLENRVWVLLLGCLLILLGVLLEMYGIVTILLFNRLIGLCLIGGGIAMLVWAFQVKKTVKGIKKELKDIESIEVEIK